MDFILTGGEVPDIKVAPLLVARNKMKWLLADKAYDSNVFHSQFESQHIKACVPAKSNRISPAFKTLYPFSRYPRKRPVFLALPKEFLGKYEIQRIFTKKFSMENWHENFRKRALVV